MRKCEHAVFTNMCMIYDENGNVLVEERTDPAWPGIAFPGGHTEPGEPFTDAVIREVFEETGLRVSGLRMCGIKDWILDDGTRYVVHLYKTNRFSGELCSSEEGVVRWVPIRNLPDMALADGMHSMLRLFCGDTYCEQFFYRENGTWTEVLK
ncbi:MAG: 8-oxo-dGTP diphosphatase [Eubacteriales bacterium]